jgi:hypothetical protein
LRFRALNNNYYHCVTGTLDVQENWQQVSREMQVMLALFTLENLTCCIPLFILSGNIRKRNEYLNQNFPPLYEENQATKIAYSLSIICPIIYIAAPFIQYW